MLLNTEMNENPRPRKSIVELVKVVKSYSNKTILDGICLKINEGEFVTLLGPSGSGKTTILRLIGGFETPTRGEIKFDGLDVKDLPSHKRFTCTIFQNYALFPHLNVFKNIQYGLKLKRIPLIDVSKQVFEKREILEKEWLKRAQIEMKKLDKEQAKYEKIMLKNKRSTPTYKKARKWMDNSDFHYSYWENYVNLKREAFDKKNTTRKINKKEMLIAIADVIKRVRLEGFEDYKIDELSGGMQQRVALARAIVTEPKVLLLDEPLSALDLKVRQQTQVELKNLHRRLGITFILITHNQEEALELSDRVAIMHDGKIIQYDTPKKIYHEPINAWVANFIGNSNVFPGRITSNRTVEVQGFEIKFIVKPEFKVGEEVDVLIRPEQLKIVPKSQNKIAGVVIEKTYKGSYYELKIKSLNSSKVFIVNSTDEVKIDSIVSLSWELRDVHIMKKEIVDVNKN